MNFNEYQLEASKTAIYPNVGDNLWYPGLGITEEAGEVAGKIKKIYRDKNGIVSEEDKKAIIKELGDVLWYMNAICGELGIELEEVAIANVEKTNKRRETNTINGSGDNREEDQRYVLDKERLRTCTTEELHRILDNLEITCFDTFNYDPESKTYCPIAIAMNLHNTIPNPTDQLIKEEIGKRFVPTNIFKGTPGKFYTTNRREDVINLCKEIIAERKVDGIVQCSCHGGQVPSVFCTCKKS